MAKNPVGVASLFIGSSDSPSETWNCSKSSCRPSRPKREMLPSQTEITNYSEVPQTGQISVTVQPLAGQDSTALANIVDGTAVLTERNGVVWYGSNLVQTSEAEYDTAEGTQEFVFEGTVTREMAS